MFYYNVNDETLVMLTLAGDQGAFEALIVRYQNAVIASAVSVIHNQYMAEDAAQDAFVAAWMKLNTLQERAKFGVWVCRIAKNCALNMVTRFRAYLPLETAENLNVIREQEINPAELYVSSEENDELKKSIGKLPGKVREIIDLHYFGGLSIAEIADKMHISEGTVKWQLHNGRKRIRKELCAMNEKYGDKLIQRVMKKVAELKQWQFKNNKKGFETVYRDVLREVENLPESVDKSHALADVLLRGWWWIPGDKNDALLERIADAAIEGKNEEVMSYIVAKEDAKFWKSGAVDFIRNKQIPRLEKAGLSKTLGREWFWLGYSYFCDGRDAEGDKAYDKAREILTPGDAYYVLVPYTRKINKILAENYKERSEKQYFIGSHIDEFRLTDKKLRYWTTEGITRGSLNSVDRDSMKIFRNSSLCDGLLFADINVGEAYIGSDGTELSFVSKTETVETPAGIFSDCQLWITKYYGDKRYSNKGKIVCRSYYKDGIGVVRHEHIVDGVSDVKLLSAYKIVGGSGLIPIAHGNSWEYTAAYQSDIISAELLFEVSYADENRVLIASWEDIVRHRYDENSWYDMIQKIRCEYYKEIGNGQKLCDVYGAAERAKILAKTPMEIAHTKSAVSVITRILETDTELNPDCTATGHWNFFSKNPVKKNSDNISINFDFHWSFEWREVDLCTAETPLFYNDIYGILQDSANCIWSDEWRAGVSSLVEYSFLDNESVKTQISCENAGIISTKAGTFDNCLRLSMKISGLDNGLAYRGGNKTYYFAEGVGIVRTENEYCGGLRIAVYELSSYEGVGKGYMPFEDGMFRRYDAVNLTDGYVGAAEYNYVADEDGDIIIFSDRTGIRELPPVITRYDTIQGEIIEDDLWKAGKHNESRMLHDINNFNLLCHFLGRPGRYWSVPERAFAWHKYKLRIMEGLGENGEVPDAWLGHYSSTYFRAACALFGCGKKNEGYEYLEKVFGLFFKWNDIEAGEEMDVGDPLIYGGIKVVKGKSVIKLPDGTLEPIFYKPLFEEEPSLMLYGMTAPHGWEWFDSVRNEERFKLYVDKALEETQTAR
ncbi:MAG: hypothetical protein DBX36_03170 [Oscillospiraceae bacterium]|nr:MAG: hypothetical protein DBX36_03170 [Oscillospiraceae bacterium]